VGDEMNDTVVPVACCSSENIERFIKGTARRLHAHPLSLKKSTDALIYSEATVTALQSRIAELEKDAARLEWVLPIVCGDCDKFADARTMAMAVQLANGKDRREAIDAAIEASK
jgi:hypothetical protein